MKKKEIAVIFDMDGVIVDNDVYHFRAWGAGMKVIGVSTTHAAFELKGTIKNINDFTEIIAYEVIQFIKTA